MKALLSLCGFLYLSALSSGADLTLPNGTVYKDFEITNTGPDYITVSHEGGITQIKYTQLSPEQRDQYNMTILAVQERLKAQEEKRKEQRDHEVALQKMKLEATKQLREAMNESSEKPRYLRGQEVQSLFALMGEISAVEAEVIALQWNIAEAGKAGLTQEADLFREQLTHYNGSLKKIREDRQLTQQYWETMRKDYDLLKSNTKEQITSLKNQVNSLQDEVKDANKRTNVIITGPAINGPWNYHSPVIIPQPCPKPHPSTGPVHRPAPHPALRTESREIHFPGKGFTPKMPDRIESPRVIIGPKKS